MAEKGQIWRNIFQKVELRGVHRVFFLQILDSSFGTVTLNLEEKHCKSEVFFTLTRTGFKISKKKIIVFTINCIPISIHLSNCIFNFLY